MNMTITNSTILDIPEIFRLYGLATDYQKVKFPDNQWPAFDPELIATEVAENRQYKLIIDDNIACIWAITHTDVHIWEGSEYDAAIYIHRIATNPDCRGNNFVQTIVDWSKDYAIKHDKQFIRLDTCGNNERLIKHYENCGFTFLGIKKLKDTTNLPSHYHKADVCFFEIDIHRR